MDLTHLWDSGLPCLHRLIMHTSGANDGKMGWMSIAGVNATGAGATIPYLRYATQNFPKTNFPDRLHFGKSVMKLNLYGCKTRPTTFTLSLVRFKKDNYTPVNDQATAEVPVCDEIGTALWQSRVKRLVANPIADQSSIRTGDMVVISKRVYNIAPTSTTEADPDPHCITVNWTHDMNKIVSMRKYQSVSTDDAHVIDAQRAQVDVETTQVTANYTPFAKDRVYLMIEATAWTPLAEADAVNADTSPSIEYNFKTTVRCDV